MRLAHVRDIQLANNAGIALPVCMAGARLLNTGFRGRVLSYEDAKQSPRACPKCLKGYAKLYPWALREA